MAALLHQSHYLRSVMESELDPRVLLAAVHDENGSIVDLMYLDANERTLTELGMERSGLVGGRMLELFPRQREIGMFDRYVHTLQTGEPLILDEELWPGTADEPAVWVDLRAVRVDDTLSITWRIVTERHRARAALAASEARYRLLAEHSSDVVAACNNEGLVTWISDSVRDRLGWRPEDLVGRGFAELIHEADLAEVLRTLAAVRQGQASDCKARIATHGGDHRWFSIQVRPQFDDYGHVTGRVVGWRDITDEQAARQALEHSRALYQLVAENAAEVVLLLSPQAEVIWISPSVERLSGWPAESLMRLNGWRLLHPDDAPSARAAVAEVLEGTQTRVLELRILTGQGQYRYWTAALKRTSMAADAGVVATLRDVHSEILVRQRAAAEATRREVLLDSMLDPYVLLQAVRDASGEITDFTFVDANRAACEYNGMTRDELLGASLLELLPGHQESGLFASYCHTVDSGEPLILDDVTYPNELLEDARRYDIRGAKVEDALSYTWRDVTERSLMAERLASSEETLRLFAANTSDVIGVADTTGIVQWVSPALTTNLGWLPEHWIGHEMAEFVHPAHLASVHEVTVHVLNGAEVASRQRVRDVQDEYHWVEVRAAPLIDGGVIKGITATMTLIDDRVAYEEALRHQASHDPLTGLLTREEVYKRLTRILSHDPRTGSRTFLAFIDLDNLKAINDEFGHAAGDDVLRLVAERTKSALRDDDLIARIGGDEFLLILPGMQDTDAAVKLGDRLLETVAQPPTFLEGLRVQPRMSIGLTEVLPGEDTEAVVRRADAAMYAAKAAGGHCLRVAEVLG
jgi:diguanylate cyclase (GGDEF)-like protein/PAS domain S-box-containing protein